MQLEIENRQVQLEQALVIWENTQKQRWIQFEQAWCWRLSLIFLITSAKVSFELYSANSLWLEYTAPYLLKGLFH